MINKLRVSMTTVANLSNYQGYLYNMQDILITIVLGLLCSLRTIESIYHWSEVEHVREFLKKEFSIEGLPKKSQFYNILTFVSHKQFVIEFEKWAWEFMQESITGKTIAIDGKAIRSTGKLSPDNSIITIASAIISDNGLIIASRECKNKNEGEIGAFREIISLLQIDGAMIVADALHCKPKSAQAVIEANADYLFTVKNNNKHLRESIELSCFNNSIDEFITIDKNGGRIENRTAYVVHDINSIGDIKKRKNASCVGAIKREFEKNSTISTEWHYYITSKKLTAEQLLHHARLEWRVESMHWLLDVHYTEDKTRLRDMEAQKNLNLMRKFALNLAKQYQLSLEKHKPISRILEANLFDIKHLERVITFFRKYAQSE